MANMVLNSLSFSGDEENIKRVIKVFANLKNQEELTDKGQSWNPLTELFLFEIEFDEFSANYYTKWTSNIEDVYNLAKEYQVDFILFTEELGNMIFEEYKLENSQLYFRELIEEDFDLVVESEEDNTYTFDNNVYDDTSEPYQKILEQKQWRQVEL